MKEKEQEQMISNYNETKILKITRSDVNIFSILFRLFSTSGAVSQFKFNFELLCKCKHRHKKEILYFKVQFIFYNQATKQII